MDFIKEELIEPTGKAEIWYDKEEGRYVIYGLDYFDYFEKWADTLEEAGRIIDEYNEEVRAEESRREYEHNSQPVNYYEWARKNYG